MDTGIGNFIQKTTLVSFIALAGCGVVSDTPSEAEFPGDEMVIEMVETDVIAPEAFSITDKGLWDGRPTFGGVWIAYPNIETPERVRITNSSNGTSVIAALYRREREFAGPKIEMSADAASALSVVAGTPAELTIVALRRVEVEATVARSSIPQPMKVPLQRPGTVLVPAVIEATTEIAAPVVLAPSTTGTPAIEATALAPAAVISGAVADALAETDGPSAPPIAAPLEPGLYVQVATLDDVDRANELLLKLQTAGLSAQIREARVGQKVLYRIVAGPASSPESQEIMLSTVGQLGYKDAVPLR